MRNSWRLKTSSLKEGSNAIRFEVSPEEVDIKPYHGCDITLTRNTIADLDLLRQGDHIYVSGKISFQARLDCAVCAEVFTRNFSEPIYIEFEHGAPIAPHKVHELGEDELVRAFYTEDEIDVLPMIRDTILLAVPIAPTCAPDCKGICPDCGANLNREACSCCKTESVTQHA
jgi:uncharacterized protein